MAFPTTSLANNQVHKEGNRAWVYDSTAGVWDQVKEVDNLPNGIHAGTIGHGVTLGSNVKLPSDNFIKTYYVTMARGYSNGSSAGDRIAPYGSGQGLPTGGQAAGVLIATISGVVLDGTQTVMGKASTPYGEWQNNQDGLMVCWATKPGTETFIWGAAANQYASVVAFGFSKVLPAGTWEFTIKIGPVDNHNPYGSWWGGAAVYGGAQWGDNARGFFELKVGGTT